jgi:hypothetical protein
MRDSSVSFFPGGCFRAALGRAPKVANSVHAVSTAWERAAKVADDLGFGERAHEIRQIAARQPALADLSDALKRLAHQNTDKLAELLAAPIALPEPPAEMPVPAPEGAPQEAPKPDGQDATPHQPEATPEPPATAAAAQDDGEPST